MTVQLLGTSRAMQPVGKYVVYDPPQPELPFLAVLFMPGLRPRAFAFETYGEAREFLTANAVAAVDEDREVMSRNH